MDTVPVLMPFADRWDGVRWSLLPLPGLPPGGQQGGMQTVSCTSGRACMAVGRYFGGRDGLFAERWDGSRWSLERMPDPVSPTTISDEGAPVIGGVSCSSDSFCTAVGFYDLNSGIGQTFAERWDGRSWSIEITPRIGGAFATELWGVSCTSRSACTAVGESNLDGSPQAWRTLAERWDGSAWSIQRTPSVRGGPNELVGVSCTSNRACMAVGQIDTNSGFRLLVERKGGTYWSVEHTLSADGVLPQAISCASPLVCTAVANTRDGIVAIKSAPARAELTGLPARCTSVRLRVHVTGAGIASVAWTLDRKPITGHTVRRETSYLASIRISPGRHKLTVKVTFTPSSQTPPRTFRRDVLGCRAVH